MERHAVPSLQLCAEDILNPESFFRKLDAIRSYYREKIERETKYIFDQFDHDTEDCQLFGYILELRELLEEGVIKMVNEADVFSCGQEWQTFIFEGAQGVLLDLNFGYAPHVTKSNTTSRNALEMQHRNFDKSEIDVEVFYVTRAYQTRHGAGPFYQCRHPMLLNNTESETNQYNEFQREFRISCLNVDELNYALSCDMNFSSGIKKSLTITCLDQLPGEEVRV